MVDIKDIDRLVKDIFGSVWITNMINSSIIEEFIRGMTTINVEFGSDTASGIMIPKELLNLLHDNVATQIKGLSDSISIKVKNEIVSAYAKQDNVRVLRKKIQEIMEIGKTRAQLIARTETARAHNLGSYYAAKNSGLSLKKYLLVRLDERTSDICGKMHSKYGSSDKAINMDDNFHVEVNGKIIEKNLPDFHPNCRTTTLYFQVPIKK
jgi:SPP1 gp7 family putative phage head morphogenesis protein